MLTDGRQKHKINIPVVSAGKFTASKGLVHVT